MRVLGSRCVGRLLLNLVLTAGSKGLQMKSWEQSKPVGKGEEGRLGLSAKN